MLISPDCQTCQTVDFCRGIGRCFSEAIYEKFGETDMEDLDEVADQGRLKIEFSESDIFKKPMTDEVFDIIKEILK